MRILLLSTYDLGRQPFGLASPAAWLRRASHHVTCQDLALDALDEAAVCAADLVAFYLPMHTATRLATRAVVRVRALNPRTRLGFYGLYAAMNEAHLRSLGAEFILSGEFESGLLDQAARAERSDAERPHAAPPPVSLGRLEFTAPDRSGLPPLSRYARLRRDGDEHTVGYT